MRNLFLSNGMYLDSSTMISTNANPFPYHTVFNWVSFIHKIRILMHKLILSFLARSSQIHNKYIRFTKILTWSTNAKVPEMKQAIKHVHMFLTSQIQHPRFRNIFTLLQGRDYRIIVINAFQVHAARILCEVIENPYLCQFVR